MNANIQDFLVEHPSFTTGDFTEMLKADTPDIARSTVFHMLKYLCEVGAITRTCKGHFDISNKRTYNYELSETAKNISTSIQERFPLVDFLRIDEIPILDVCLDK